MAEKHVLVNGCSEGGIGAALVVCFQKHGLHVFATARKPSKMANLENLPNVTLLELDVTNPSSISDAVEVVKQSTGGKLDCLCNNAGSLIMMPALDTNIAEARKMFEVNLWGVFATTQAFPH